MQLLFCEFGQVQEFLWDVHSACYHNLCKLKKRLRSLGDFRMAVISEKPIIWKEHYMYCHLLDAVIEKGSVLRGMEESVERNIGIVKTEDKCSKSIVEPGARVANTLRRAALRGRADQPSAVNKGRKCKTCGNYVSKKFIPYCTCTK